MNPGAVCYEVQVKLRGAFYWTRAKYTPLYKDKEEATQVKRNLSAWGPARLVTWRVEEIE